MKKAVLILVLAAALLMAFAGFAQAQSMCDLISVSSEYGSPGDEVLVSGNVSPGDDIFVLFDGAEAGAATADEYGDFEVSFSVPDDAAEGEHEITVTIYTEGTVECPVLFTVAGVAQQPLAEAPVASQPATAATLPATGFPLVTTAGALLAGGIGMLMSRRRGR